VSLTADDQTAQDDAMLQKANEHFQEQKYKSHHHQVPRSKFESPTYLGTLTINEKRDRKYQRNISIHRPMRRRARQIETNEVGRLQIMKNLPTWEF